MAIKNTKSKALQMAELRVKQHQQRARVESEKEKLSQINKDIKALKTR